MKRKLLVIGIGAGNPDHVTVQAVEALNRADVFFIPDKGSEKQDLARLRTEICERFIRGTSWRMVGFDVPRRGSADAGYGAAVADWHERIESVYERLLAEEMEAGECGAFLVWGDPTLYDSTMRILERIAAKGRFELDYEIVPGISSVQALAARHKIALNTIGRPVLVTTGRRLAEGFPEGVDSVVVMLDGEQAFRNADGDLDIFWGAYVGTPDEILVSGRLAEVAGDIGRIREKARHAKGWIMDTYLLRRRRDG